MINVISAADIAFIMSSSRAIVIECSRPIRFSIVSLMYNNDDDDDDDDDHDD